MLWSNDFKYTIKDINKENKDNNKKMLSEYGSDFWSGYRANSQYFDRRFMTLYGSYFPYNQEPSEGIESVSDDFRYDVYSHLLVNDKRYSELYRVNVIQDNDAYSLTNNVDYTETYEEETHLDRDFTKGAQTNSGTFETTYGATSNGESISRSYGAHDIDTTNSTSAYNESGYTPVDKSEVDDGAHTDTESNTYTGAQHVDSGTNGSTEGQRKDTTDDDGTKEYTLHKVGNMGVQTVDDMLKKHWDNWSLFDFYGLIFAEIARDLLRGV